MSSNGDKAMTNGNPMIVVVFGRAGAGKTTVADAAIEMLSKENESLGCVGLDLDVCVPQEMRTNFSSGIYPTLKERQEFAVSACDYVDKKLLEHSALQDRDQNFVAIVSFSFVNTDLRDIFRSRFPNAMWALVDTTESEADERIKKRENHFYKGAPPQTGSKETEMEESSLDNSEWNFAPVTFPHTMLPGNESIKVNAQRVADLIKTKIDGQHTSSSKNKQNN